ncbi:MAG: peptidyl-prolyl cis-trans isomerase [Proteobacteria bacterium]|nr:peptidyl-prolyl cis-trans isomerase [Pseudomonadota bacterium]
MNRRRNIIVATLALAAFGISALAAHSGPDDANKAAAQPAPKAAPATTAAAPVDAAAEKARLALPVAKIDGVEISLEYLETALDRQSPLLRKELADAAKRKDFIDKIINMEVLAAEAKRRGFSSDPEVASVRKNQLASLMHRKIADETPEVAPTDDAMRKYYDAHADAYNKPEKVRARHILIADKAAAEKLLAEMLAKTPSQYEFRRIAQERSEDAASKNRGGDLTFFPRTAERRDGDPEVPEAVANAAFELKENGEVARKLVKTDKGYHLVMRTGHREKMSMTFEEAKERLTMLVQRDDRKNAIDAAIDALEKKYPVTLHEENLKDVVIDLSGGPPAEQAAGPLEPAALEKPATAE